MEVNFRHPVMTVLRQMADKVDHGEVKLTSAESFAFRELLGAAYIAGYCDEFEYAMLIKSFP